MLDTKFGRISGLGALAGRYKGLLCDVWGVLHNGVAVYDEAMNALTQFRKQGGNVVMITNSPRPRDGVLAQLYGLGVDEETFDDIVTSGDVTRVLIAQAEQPVFHLGPERDLPLFDGLDVELSDLSQAKAIVCTGLFDDESETPEDYREQLSTAVARSVPFICANPDLVVERGDRLIWCAGALARLYEELGGKTQLAGKPHKPIYDLAEKQLVTAAGGTLSRSQIICIGDGMPTDVAGAQLNGFDLLYIAAGIHAGDYSDKNGLDEAALQAFLKSQGATPAAWMPHLAWGESR